MSAAEIISLVGGLIIALFASITAPLILTMRTERMHREDRIADYARQDEKDRITKAAADEVAKKAEQAATDLAASQKAIADQAAEAATLLLANNERVAETQKETNGKLDVIHTLVNSNMTAAMQSELDATVRELAMMQEVMELKRTAGQEPSPETLTAVGATTTKIAELQATLADRAKAQAQVAKAGGQT
jgi:hypothetical protein